MENGFDIGNFDTVWRRVTADDTVKTANMSSGMRSDMPADISDEAEVERMRRFMDDEAHDANIYGILADRSSDTRRARIFRQMSNIEKSHLRRLQTWYFIIAGDTYTPQPAKMDITSLLGLLRDQYKGELRGAKEYAEAARTTRYEGLAEVYAANAKDEAAHAKQLQTILEDMMG